ncbi:uncharacterized protein ACIGJ3_017102 [Trichechus inunguis]
MLSLPREMVMALAFQRSQDWLRLGQRLAIPCSPLPASDAAGQLGLPLLALEAPSAALAQNVTVDEVIGAYKQACQKLNCRQIPKLLRQLQVERSRVDREFTDLGHRVDCLDLKGDYLDRGRSLRGGQGREPPQGAASPGQVVGSRGPSFLILLSRPQAHTHALAQYHRHTRRPLCLIPGEKLDYKTCEALEEVFKRLQFRVMDLEQTNLDEDGASALFDMIEYYDSATHLNISFNKHIGTRGWQAAAHMMRKS